MVSLAWCSSEINIISSGEESWTKEEKRGDPVEWREQSTKPFTVPCHGQESYAREPEWEEAVKIKELILIVRTYCGTVFFDCLQKKHSHKHSITQSTTLHKLRWNNTNRNLYSATANTEDRMWMNRIFSTVHIIQICYGITRGRVLNGELYAQRLQKLIYLHLFTDCFMKISLQTSEQISEQILLCFEWWLERNLHETVCKQMQIY